MSLCVCVFSEHIHRDSIVQIAESKQLFAKCNNMMYTMYTYFGRLPERHMSLSNLI